MPDHSVVHRYARCLSYPEWGVGSVNGIYFTGDGDDVQQWARVTFQLGIRTVPAGSLQFVDFSKPDPGAERVERFMTAAKHALAEGDFTLAARRLVFARDAEPGNTGVLRLLTLAFWQAGDFPAAGARRARLGARRARAPGAVPLRRAHLRGPGRAAQAVDAAERAPPRPDRRVRVGAPRAPAAAALRPRGARAALEHARALGPSVEGLLDLALTCHLVGDVGGEVTASDQATLLDARQRPRGRATRTRSPARTASAMRSPRPSARSSSPPTTPRSRTSSSACARPSSECSPPHKRLRANSLRP